MTDVTLSSAQRTMLRNIKQVGIRLIGNTNRTMEALERKGYINCEVSSVNFVLLDCTITAAGEEALSGKG